jgi:hypothetical protein
VGGVIEEPLPCIGNDVLILRFGGNGATQSGEPPVITMSRNEDVRFSTINRPSDTVYERNFCGG